MQDIRREISYVSFFAIFMLALLSMSGCKTLFQTPIDAKGAYESKQYTLAAELLAEEYRSETDLLKKSKMARQIGDCHRLANNTQQAEQWYLKALDYTDDPSLSFTYGLMLKANGKYDAAQRQFKDYALANPMDRTRATRELQACRQAIEWQKKPTDHKVTNAQSLNSSASDFAPVLYMKKRLVFTSARNEATGGATYGWTGEKHADLFEAQIAGEVFFKDITQFGDSINTPFNEGTATFSPDFREVYFTGCGSESSKDDYCKIYTSRKNADGKWLLPEPLFFFDADTVNEGQPYLTPDGTSLYFASDAPGGYGGKDIYVAQKQAGGTWGEPKNLGPAINTEGYEGFPFISADGKFYFASDGHMGMGGLDLFAAERVGKRWDNPQNLQAPLNSAADDFAIIFEPYIAPELMDSIEAAGYFCSSRTGGRGNDDIYRFVLSIPPPPEVKPPDTTEIVQEKPPAPPTVYLLTARVFQKQFEYEDNPESRYLGNVPLPDAQTEVLGLSSGSSLARRSITDQKGEYTLKVEPQSDYLVTGSKNGFFKKSLNATTKGKQAQPGDTVKVVVDLILDKVYKGREITLQNIYYDLDKWDIREDAKPTLNQLAQLLYENPNIKIRMGSHTDSRGSDAYNSELSQKRAQSAIDYLVSKGINPTRLEAKGYGETRLVNDCGNGSDCSEEEHQQNRRTTFEVISDTFRGVNSGF